jgi:uroporphyrinogen III methyltransferase / synthase
MSRPCKTMPARVYLVGAGPGDPGLLTLKGKVAIERADCVVYDFLAAASLLRYSRPEAEKVFAGKRGGGPRRPQEEINDLIIARARSGLTVVRLKGGDPFVFGRGGEEAEALVKAGIPFEIVPGVTSGIAAPAYAGIPVTHREFVSSVSFISGHGAPAEEGAGLDWKGIAASSGTLVLFMGTSNLAAIAKRLVDLGRAAETPAAVIRWGTRAAQQVVTGTLGDIAHRAEGVQPPTIIVVGEVVRLRERLNWFERLPLFGKRIVVTRAREQAGPLIERLEELGAETVLIPTIEFRKPESWAALDEAIRRLKEFDYLLVTSANGVRSFLARLAEAGRDVRDLHGLTIGAIGPATANQFAQSGIKVDFVPHEYRAEGILEALENRTVKGKAFLIPRAKVARDLIPKVLTERGARVEVAEAYAIAAPTISRDEWKELLTPAPDAITFTSSSTATHFAQMLGGRPIQEALSGVVIASIGPITSATLQKLGLRVDIEAQESSVPGLVQALVSYFSDAK